MSEPPAMSFEDSAAPCSDMGNAQVMLRWYHDVVRWVPVWRKWFSWDPEGGLWAAEQGALQYAQQTAISLYHLALERQEEEQRSLTALLERFRPSAPEVQTAKERTAKAASRVRWYVRSQMIERTRAILVQAQTLPEFQASPDDWDNHPFLLSTPTGTVDLLTGKLQSPRKEHLLTRTTKIPYDAAAACPTWEKFLLQVMCGDAELVSYLQRIAGYCLTGSTEEHFLGFFYGDGANGKSTFLAMLAEAAGDDYYCQAPRGLLFWGSHERHPTELASLYKRRLVICPEVEDSARLDEAKVKDLTGGDQISCRRMREDFWTFRATHKLLIAGNHWFFVRGQDTGIWRRIHVVPWRLNLSQEEIDTTIVERLRAELPGILAWAVRGAVEWRSRGLAEPASCATLRDEHRSEADLFRRSIDDIATFAEDGRVLCDTLYDAYLDWMYSHKHATVLSRTAFAKRVKEAGIRRGTVRVDPSRVGWGWFGVRLATAEERAARRWGTTP